MPHATATRVIQNLEGNTPWACQSDFIRALAAHSSIFRDELRRRTHQNGVTLVKLLYNTARPGRMEWLFNNLRRIHAVPVHLRSMLPTGTTANEAFHSEINAWFKNQSEIFSTTVELQLSVAVLGKQLAHSTSLYHPTLRQLRHQDLLAAVVVTLGHSPEQWTAFCSALKLVGNRVQASQPPLAQKRKALHAQIQCAIKRPAGAVKKRPAGKHDGLLQALKRPAGNRKRTVFTLHRPESLARVPSK